MGVEVGIARHAVISLRCGTTFAVPKHRSRQCDLLNAPAL